jgi:hypothetical protein
MDDLGTRVTLRDVTTLDDLGDVTGPGGRAGRPALYRGGALPGRGRARVTTFDYAALL